MSRSIINVNADIEKTERLIYIALVNILNAIHGIAPREINAKYIMENVHNVMSYQSYLKMLDVELEGLNE